MALVIIALLVERYWFEKRMFKQLDDTILALKSKDVNEYIGAQVAKTIEKEPQADPDEVLVENADDETFNKFIANQK